MSKKALSPARPQRRRWRALVSALVSATVAVGGVLVAPAAALAAPGDLTIEVQFLDGITNEPIDDLAAAVADRSNSDEWYFKLGITYGCGPVDCPDAVVHVDPQILDPYYGSKRFASYFTTSLPGAVVTSSVTNGQTIQLGDVNAGTGGSFWLSYRYQSRGVGVDTGSFFPEGYAIPASVQLSATGLGSVSAADELTWHIQTPDPRVSIASPDLARADREFTYTLYMSASCQWERSTAGHGEPAYECARDYTVTDHLDPDAVYVDSTGDYDPIAHTVTWTESGEGAAEGWGPMNALGQPRTLTVRYPEAAIDGDGCVGTISNTLDVSMTYLSGAVKTATATREHALNACEPFASAVLDGKSSSRNAGTADDALVWERASNYWYVRLANRANVPGVATVVDDDLDQAGLPVNRIVLFNSRAAIEYTLDDGTIGTVEDVTEYRAPSGRRITAATVVTAPLNGPNLEETSQTERTQVDIRYYYTVADDIPDEGWLRTNTASATMSYPDTDLPDLDLGASTYSVTAVPRPAYFRPVITAAVDGGGKPVPGTAVTYTINASTSDVPAGTPFEGQYVYVAPAGWDILPDSAAITGENSGADAISFVYTSVTIDGQERQAVFGSRPAGTVWGANESWPTMTVQATPTDEVAGGSTGTSEFYMGDAGHNFGRTTAIWGNNGNFRFVDAPDLDGDGDVTESFAYVRNSISVGETTALNVLKEICYPDSSQSDGCEWRSNPDIPVPVPPTATDITYRVTITNSGSTTQSDVVAYDVLPHVGDTGLTSTSAAVQRGSTFAETLSSSVAGTGVSLTFSDAVDPCRPEVFPGGPEGCSDTWGPDEDGASAIRAALTSALAAGESRSFTYTTAVVGDPVNGDVACNSVAIDSATTAPNEPRAVCAEIVEADLAVTAPARLPLQVGRPGVVPFVLANVAGADDAPGTVTLAVPEELTVTALEFDGWICTSPDGEAPIAGGTTLTCALDDGGITRAEDIALNLPIVAVDGDQDVCADATVTGDYYDGVPANDEASACFQILAGEPELSVVKDDGRESVSIGDEYTYTITVANRLVGEAVADVTITDELPSYLAFVSATADGVVSGRAGDGSGGTVTWSLDQLAPAANANDDGALGEAATGSAVPLSVTVRVLQSAETISEIENSATAVAADPADADVELTASGSDVDDVLRTAALSLTKSVTPETVAAAGAEVRYSFLVVNEGDVTLADVGITEQEFTGSGVDAPLVTCPTGPLAPGDDLTCTADYTITQDDVEAGSVSNTASATATAPSGLEAPESAASTALVTIPAVPAISLVKSVGPGELDTAGDVVPYVFEVTNSGNVVLDGIAIEETAFTGSGDEVAIDCPAAPLAPGASMTCDGTYTLTQADVNSGRVDNTAVATGITASGTDVRSPESSAAVVIGAEPGLSVVKSASSGELEADREVTYSFVVTNTGNVTLGDVAIEESEFTGSGELGDVVCEPGAEALDPGEQLICRADYTITQDDVDAGSVSNTAAATAQAPGGRVRSDPSSVQLPFAQDPSVSLEKSADVAGFEAAGQQIEYRFLVTNTGNVTIDDIQVAEGEFSGSAELSGIACETTSLLPGQRVLCTAGYETTQADVDAGELSNAATASGLAPAADSRTTSAPSRVVTPFTGAMSMSLTKSGAAIDVDGDARTTEADRIQWTFTVENTGAATLHGVAIADPMAGEVECEADELAPGATTECAAVDEYQIRGRHALAGRVLNVATASAVGVGDAAVASAEAQAVVEVEERAAAAPGGGLAVTGADSRPLIAAGILALLFGGALLLLRRRRSRHDGV